MMSRKRMLLLGSLILVTFLGVAFVYAELTSQEPPLESGLYYVAEPLPEVPDKSWNLTDPDPYVFRAVENPGVYVLADQHATTFLQQVDAHSNVYNVQYKGSYYHVLVFYNDDWHFDRKPTSIIILTALAASWVIALVPLLPKKEDVKPLS